MLDLLFRSGLAVVRSGYYRWYWLGLCLTETPPITTALRREPVPPFPHCIRLPAQATPLPHFFAAQLMASFVFMAKRQVRARTGIAQPTAAGSGPHAEHQTVSHSVFRKAVLGSGTKPRPVKHGLPSQPFQGRCRFLSQPRRRAVRQRLQQFAGCRGGDGFQDGNGAMTP